MEENRIKVVGVSVETVQRHFMRSIEDERVRIEGLCVILVEGSCTVCRNTVASAIFDMKNAHQERYLRGATLVTSDAPLPPGVSLKKVVTVGVCVPKGSRSPRHVAGCPPNNIQIINAIVAGREETKRTYSTEESEARAEIDPPICSTSCRTCRHVPRPTRDHGRRPPWARRPGISLPALSQRPDGRAHCSLPRCVRGRSPFR